ncbi:MAG: hypothetical protein WCT23_07860 [Candidatus Neomarinimicrobiota bacterium]
MRIRQLVLMLLCFSMSSILFADLSNSNLYRLAGNFERKGEYAKAESLYVHLFDAEPGNYNYFSRYKSSLLFQQKYDDIKILLEERFNKNQRDIYTEIELSIVYYVLDEKRKAIKHWQHIFSGKNSRMHRSYANNLYSKVLEYRLGGSFYKIVDELRTITNKNNFLVNYNFSTAFRFRNWDQAIDEILHIIRNNPTDLKYVRQYLFLQDPESLLYEKALSKLSSVQEAEALILMSDINLHIENYKAALMNLSTMNENTLIQSALEKLAHTLIDEEAFDLSYAAAKRAFDYSKSTSTDMNMRFIMAESLKGKFEKNNRVHTLIPKPFVSTFTQLPILSFEASDIALIEDAYSFYDSLSYSRGKIAESSTLKLIDIEHIIYQDIDAALKRALTILPEISIENRVTLLGKIANLHMAKGDIERARDFIETAPETFSLMVHEEDRLLATLLHVSVLSSESDSLAEQSDLLLSLLEKDDPLYNDILNYMAFISVFSKDSINYENWQEAERELVQQDLAEAAGIYFAMLQSQTEAKFVIALRYLDCVQAMKDKEAERIFWDDYYEELQNIEMSDYFMLAYADFLEKSQKGEKAAEIYEKFLLFHQESMYIQQVRSHLRKIKH